MSNDEPTQTKDIKDLTTYLRDLLKVLGGVVGASSLGMTVIYAMGFVVINTSLLRYGAYELSLLRAEFLAAGISCLVLTLGMILFGAMAVHGLVEKVVEPLWKLVKRLLEALEVWHRIISLLVIFLGAVVLLLSMNHVAGYFLNKVQSQPELLEGQLLLNKAARLFLAGVQWWNRFDTAIIWGCAVIFFGGIYVEHLDRKDFWRKLTAPGTEIPEIGKPILLGIALLLTALVTYGGCVYPYLPKSWGGGSPIYVEFVVEEEAKTMLETLGLKVGDKGLTERVTFLTECPERIFVVTQRGDTLSFDSGLVKASKFYDVNYYATADAHLTNGDWYREQRQWSRAISEYNAALLIQADLLDARIGRGRAYTEKYLESARKESPDQQAYDSANDDLTGAILQAEKTKDDQRAARAHYHRGRLRFHHVEHKDKTSEDVAQAIHLDSSFLRDAMLEEDFWESIQATDATFRRALHDSDSWLAGEYARLGREFEDGGEAEQAVALYDLAAYVAEHFAKDAESAAQYRAYKGNVLEKLPRVEDAIEEYKEAVRLMPKMAEYRYRLALLSYEYDRSEDAEKEYREAVKLNPTMTHYRYRFALLYYEYGLLEQAEKECQELIGQAKATKEDVATISCRIVLGNVYRDLKKWNVAGPEYDQAANQALESGTPSLAAEAYYHRARLEARSEDPKQAIPWLTKAVWLDRAHSEKAELEGDFDILRASVDYQKAIAPPIVKKIESDSDKRTVSFRLQEPADDFPERVAILTQILQRADLITPDGTGQAESFEVSEDQLLYTFQLRQDALYSASDLAIGLRELLGLAGEPLTQESSATD